MEDSYKRMSDDFMIDIKSPTSRWQLIRSVGSSLKQPSFRYQMYECIHWSVLTFCTRRLYKDRLVSIGNFYLFGEHSHVGWLIELNRRYTWCRKCMGAGKRISPFIKRNDDTHSSARTYTCKTLKCNVRFMSVHPRCLTIYVMVNHLRGWWIRFIQISLKRNDQLCSQAKMIWSGTRFTIYWKTDWLFELSPAPGPHLPTWINFNPNMNKL